MNVFLVIYGIPIPYRQFGKQENKRDHPEITIDILMLFLSSFSSVHIFVLCSWLCIHYRQPFLHNTKT